jgi:hypothetical protein
VSIAEETDELVASLPDELLAGLDETSPLNPVRADHRAEHLDEIEEAIRPGTSKTLLSLVSCARGGKQLGRSIVDGH